MGIDAFSAGTRRSPAPDGTAVADPSGSQALHALSKIRAADSWHAITPALLRDADDEVARSAWRAAVVLAPKEEHHSLAVELASQLGRGDRRMQLSLSRAVVTLGLRTGA